VVPGVVTVAAEVSTLGVVTVALVPTVAPPVLTVPPALVEPPQPATSAAVAARTRSQPDRGTKG